MCGVRTEPVLFATPLAQTQVVFKTDSHITDRWSCYINLLSLYFLELIFFSIAGASTFPTAPWTVVVSFRYKSLTFLVLSLYGTSYLNCVVCRVPQLSSLHLAIPPTIPTIPGIISLYQACHNFKAIAYPCAPRDRALRSSNCTSGAARPFLFSSAVACTQLP